MSTQTVAKKKPNKISEGKVEFRAEQSLIAEIDAEADHEHMTRSVWIRRVLREAIKKAKRERGEQGTN